MFWKWILQSVQFDSLSSFAARLFWWKHERSKWLTTPYRRWTNVVPAKSVLLPDFKIDCLLPFSGNFSLLEQHIVKCIEGAGFHHFLPLVLTGFIIRPNRQACILHRLPLSLWYQKYGPKTQWINRKGNALQIRRAFPFYWFFYNYILTFGALKLQDPKCCILVVHVLHRDELGLFRPS